MQPVAQTSNLVAIFYILCLQKGEWRYNHMEWLALALVPDFHTEEIFHGILPQVQRIG